MPSKLFLAIIEKEINRKTDERTYSKSQQGMISKTGCDKSHTESGQNFYDSSRTDSGFISGVNLVSEQNLSCEDLDLSQQVSQKRESDICSETQKQSDTFMRLDSGLDLGLNEQFSELTLEQKEQLNDLNASVKFKSLIHQTSLSQSNICVSNCENKPKSSVSSVHSLSQPWEYYFHQNDDGDTHLHIAIIQSCVDVACKLIRMVPHPVYLSILNDMVQSPLHLAVLTRQPRVVRELIVAGADFEARDRHGNTPLHLACEIGDFECVKELTKPIAVSEVADAGLLYTGYTQQVPQDFEEKNYEGETCLHLAAYGGHLDILKHLINYGADVNARDGKSGRTVLHYSVESGNSKLLRFLLGECPIGHGGLHIDTPDYAGRTAYQLACVIDASVAAALVRIGANIDVEDLSEDEHPDHNMEDEDEISVLDNVFSNMENFQRSRESYLLSSI